MDRRRSHPQFRIQEARWDLNGGRGTVFRHQVGLRGWPTTNSKFWLKTMDVEEGVDHHDFLRANRTQRVWLIHNIPCQSSQSTQFGESSVH